MEESVYIYKYMYIFCVISLEVRVPTARSCSGWGANLRVRTRMAQLRAIESGAQASIMQIPTELVRNTNSQV